MAEPDTRLSAVIHPERGIGWITLGASLHAILTRLKAQPQSYPELDLSYSASDPVLQPIILNLPANGIRLRFDGPDQRLRLIEVLDFSKSTLTYDNIELVRRSKSSNDGSMDQQASAQGPPFRHIYNRLFGPSYAGEYVAPAGSGTGTYVLSYPGISFSFPLRDKSWSTKADFVSLLSSTAAGPATSMAVYQGRTWPEARTKLYTAIPSLPRSLALSNKNKEAVPDEIEQVRILGSGRLEFLRRSSPSLQIILNETTPQDLVAELGPPDAIYRKNDRRISIHAGRAPKNNRQASLSPAMRPHTTESDQSSAHSYTEDSDEGAQNQHEPSTKVECFYNYFHHGFDALVSYPSEPSPPFPDSNVADSTDNTPTTCHLVVNKILLHANVPGSYSFNRHRRSRWTIHTSSNYGILTSEMFFPELSSKLKGVWQGYYKDADEEERMQRSMVLNRGWGESPESSIELLGGFEEQDTGQKKGGSAKQGPSESVNGLSNTALFGFPGLLFEVLKNDAVSCLTVY
jgi:Uncharacterised protein family (UPF0183)